MEVGDDSPTSDFVPDSEKFVQFVCSLYFMRLVFCIFRGFYFFFLASYNFSVLLSYTLIRVFCYR